MESERPKLVCRTCLRLIEDDIFFYINENNMTGNKSLANMLENSVPEVGLQLTEAPIMCSCCATMLQNAYIFKERCCETEMRIYKYMEENNLKFNINLRVDLIDVIMGNELKQLNDISRVESSVSDIKIERSELTYITDSKVDPSILIISDDEIKIECNLSQQINDDIEHVFIKNNDEDLECKISDDSPDEQSIVESVISSSDFFQSNSIRNGLKRIYTCKNCEYKGYRADLLSKHKLKCKNKSVTQFGANKLFKCDTCSYQTNRNSHLVRHKLTHGGKRSHTCKVCEKSFTEHYQLKIHMIRHTQKEGSFECEVCDFKYFRKCDLTAHVHSKHSDNNMRPKKHKCEQCGKKYFARRDYLAHMHNNHEDKNIIKKLNHACDLCDFSSVYVRRLKKHKIRIHPL